MLPFRGRLFRCSSLHRRDQSSPRSTSRSHRLGSPAALSGSAPLHGSGHDHRPARQRRTGDQNFGRVLPLRASGRERTTSRRSRDERPRHRGHD
jgi:hypothetical protein